MLIKLLAFIRRLQFMRGKMQRFLLKTLRGQLALWICLENIIELFFDFFQLFFHAYYQMLHGSIICF